jgi:hypothetical protein
MVRRKGELTPAGVDREYPYQIALPQNESTGSNSTIKRNFCKNLSLAPRGHSFVRDDEWHNVFCFAQKEHAEQFQQHFGGEWFDPARRGRGGRWHLLKDARKRYY